MAASAVAGVALPSTSIVFLLIAMSLFYIAGMYYNDACDTDFDTQHQPHRPIPSGLISRQQVEGFALSYAIIAFLLIYMAQLFSPQTQGNASIGWLAGTLSLISCIVVYDRHHKNNPFSPLLMAGCRISVLVTTAYALVPSFPPILLLALLATLAWLIGLTFLAKHEQAINLSTSKLLENWPLMLLSLPVLAGAFIGISSPTTLIPVIFLISVIWIAQARLRHGPAHLKGRAIALMIAGICLVDGIFLAWIWGITGVAVALIAFALTLALQRWVAGT